LMSIMLAPPSSKRDDSQQQPLPPQGQLCRYLRLRGTSVRGVQSIQSLLGVGDGRYRHLHARSQRQYFQNDNRLEESWLPTYHVDNFSKCYYASTVRKQPGLGHERSEANWTACGRTFTLVPKSAVLRPPHGALPLWPANGAFHELPDVCVQLDAEPMQIASHPAFPDGFSEGSASAAAEDYAHPLGTQTRTLKPPPYDIQGTRYRPLELLAENIGSGQGLFNVIRYLCARLPSDSYQIVRADINIWWLVLKACNHASFAPFLKDYGYIAWVLPPWHNLKHLALTIWGVLAPGNPPPNSHTSLWLALTELC